MSIDPGQKCGMCRVCTLIVEDSMKHRLKEAQLSDPWVKAIRKVLESDSYVDFYLKILHKNPVKD